MNKMLTLPRKCMDVGHQTANHSMRTTQSNCVKHSPRSVGHLIPLLVCALLIVLPTHAWGDTATLPVEYSFDDGKSSLPTGVTESGLGGDYAATNSPYRLKFDNSGDYIQIQVDGAAQTITVGIKEYASGGGASVKIQGSSDGSSFADIQTLSFSQGQNKTSSQSTSNTITSTYRYFRIIRGSSGGNFGLGTLAITKAAAAEPYTVIFTKTDGTTTSLTEGSVGAGVTPPAMQATCEDWEFQGWSTTESDDDESTDELALVTLTAGKYYPSSNITLYPVYTKTGSIAFSRYEKVTSAPSDWTAHKYVYATADDGKVMTGKSGNNTYGAYATMSTTTEMEDYEISVATTATSGRYKISQGGKYITCTSTGSLNWVDSYTAATTSINNCDWQFYLNSGAYRIEIPFKVSNSWYYINYNSSSPRFNTYSSQTAAFLYKRVEETPTYYYSYPTCTPPCTDLGQINGPVIVTQNSYVRFTTTST